MHRAVYRLLLAFALVCAGGVAQLHALAHAQHDLAVAASPAHYSGEGVPQLNHATDQCLVIHALDGAAAESGAGRTGESVASLVVLPVSGRCGEAPAAAFRSRAPPLPV